MKKASGDRIRPIVTMEIVADNQAARFEDFIGSFDVSVLGDDKGIVTQDEITKDILLALPDGAAVRIRLQELGKAVVKCWGQWKVKKATAKGRK